jgi:serine/threonine protein kinase
MPTTTVLGTSAYMAPEAFRGDVSIKLDTFSFGVVSWRLLKNSQGGKVYILVYLKLQYIFIHASFTEEFVL